ncbi:MAG TPA: hypothetical protein VM241_00290, partial [Candidatus Thermoplasmatota archaeon]|nr:hypothetical protein [Candidatus Thermoplasmatota archaeon]
MNQVARALVACLLLGILSDGSLPHASAQSTDDPAALPPSSALPVPAFPSNRTGVIPLDRALDDAAAQYVTVQRTAGETYTAVAAAIHDASKGVVKEPLVLYADGAASLTQLDGTATDPRKGGYGAWTQVGDQPWRPDPGAAKSGLSGFTVAQPSGGYAGGQHSLLLTPQLDLQTDLLDPELAKTGQGPGAPPPDKADCVPYVPGASLWSILSTIFQRFYCSPNLTGRLYDCIVDPRYVGCDSAGGNAVLLDRHDSVFNVQFKARYNLGVNSGANQDGVALFVFTKPPTAAQVRDRLVPDGCIKDINCTVVIPFGPEPAGTPGKVPATPPWYKA